MKRRARVMLHAKVRDGAEEQFEKAYETVAERMRHSKGHIQDELVRNPDASTPSYVVLSEWVDKDAFLAWFHDPSHHETTAPMNPYWYDPRLEIFELIHRREEYDPRGK